MLKKFAGAVAATALVFGIGGATAAPASAVDNIKPFGQQIRILDWAGGPSIGYTVQGLAPSSDPIPHNGQLYEAVIVVDTFGAQADSMIHRFAARSADAAMFPLVLAAGVGGMMPPGASATGKLYFDAVGPDVPSSVVYNDGMRDILAWIPGAQEGGSRP
jgi:hypothetical protein